MTTSNDIANQALAVVGNNLPPVTGQAPTFDNSTAGVALQRLYVASVTAIARAWQWDLARAIVALTLSGNAAPGEWAFEYLYPGNGIEVWQVRPQVPADPNNPLPVNWAVGNAVVGGVQTKVVWTSLQSAFATYNNNPTEATWDPLFREAVVKKLAADLALAILGKPDTMQALFEQGMMAEQAGEGRPN